MKIIICLSLFISSVSFAAIDTYPVAKLYSGIASAPPSMFGSGLVFRYKSELYVMTSDHVLIRDNSKSTKHSVKFQGGVYAADYIMSDWGRRYALLKLQNVPVQIASDARISDFDNMITDYNGSSSYTLMGYPAGSEALHAPSVGSWISLTLSTIASFGFDSYYMSKNTIAEFGMSGGPVFEEQASGVKVLGILSHQIYKPSQQSYEEFGPGTILNGDYTIIIPAHQIQKVVGDILSKGQSDLWNFEEMASSNAKTKEVVGSGNLIFTGKIDPTKKEMTTLDVSYSANPKSKTVRYKDEYGLFDKLANTLKTQPSTLLHVIGYRPKSFGLPDYDIYSLTGQSIAQTLLFITVWGEPVILIGEPDLQKTTADVNNFSQKLGKLICQAKAGATSHCCARCHAWLPKPDARCCWGSVERQ